MDIIVERKIILLIEEICSMKSIGCRSLNKTDKALEIFKLLDINPNDIRIFEIPLDWDNQVCICFEYLCDNSDYELFMSIDKFNDLEIEFSEWEECGNGEPVVVDYFRETEYYLSYYEEYPIYEPAEGGYYYAGRYVSSYVSSDNWDIIYHMISMLAEKYELKIGDWVENSDKFYQKFMQYGQMCVAVDESKYIGESRRLVLETKSQFKSWESGWHPYC